MTSVFKLDQRKKIVGAVCCVVYTTIFALHYTVAKEVLKTVDVWTLSWVRGWIGGLILAVIFWPKLRDHLSWRLVGNMAALACLGFGLNQVLFLYGLQQSTPGQAALLSNTIPIVSVGLSLLLQTEKFSWRKILGLSIPFFAISIFLYQQFKLSLYTNVQGNLLILSSVVCLSTFFVLSKKLLQDVPAEATSPLLLLLGGSIFALFSGFQITSAVEYVQQSWTQAALMIFEVLISTSMAYYLNLVALRLLPVSSVVVFSFLQLPITAILGYLITKSEPRLSDFILLGFVFVGFLLIFGNPFTAAGGPRSFDKDPED